MPVKNAVAKSWAIVPSFDGVRWSEWPDGDKPDLSHPLLGAHDGDWDIDGSGTSPAAITLSTQAAGSSVVAMCAGQFSTFDAPTYNSLAMSLIHTSGYAGGLWPGYGLEIHERLRIAGGAAHALQFTKTDAVRESSLIGVEIRNAAWRSDESIVARAAPGTGNPVTSDPVSVTGPALLVAFWSGDGGVGTTDQTATPEDGWTPVESLFLGNTAYIQSACAVREVTTPGDYTVAWTPVVNQGAILSLTAYQGVESSIPAVVNQVFTGGSTASTTSAAVDTTGATDLRVFVVTQTATNPTVTDSKGNTWVIEGAPIRISTTFTGYLSCFKPTGTVLVGTAHTFSATGATATSVGAIALRPNAGGTLAADAWSAVVDNSSPHAAPSVTPSKNWALLVACAAHDGAGNPTTYDWTGSGFTPVASVLNAASFWTASLAIRAVTAAGPFTPSVASSGTPTGGGAGVIVFTEQ